MGKISIIMSCYKSNFEYLSEQICSIVNQTITNWELLIYNDGTDGLYDWLIMEGFLSIPNIKYFNNGHLGYSKAYNFLLKEATGEYVCFCDHDDIWEPNKLEVEKNYLDKHKDIDCVFSWLHWFGDREKFETFDISDEEISKELYFWQPIKHPSTMFRRERFEEFDAPFDCAADFWFWAKHKDRHYHLIKKFLVNYRRHAGEATKDKTAFRLNSAKVIQHNLEERFPDCVFPLELCETFDRYSKKYDKSLKESFEREIWK